MKNIVVIVSGLLSATAMANEQMGPSAPYVDSSLYSQMDMGGTGLMQTPTSRMMPEGALAVSYADNDVYRFWSVSVQLFHWMESTVRYTDIRTQLYSRSPGFSGDQTLKDKGIDLKLRLLEEDSYLPEVSLGFKDLGGTGLFESEFITASKRWHAWDFHLGLAWGYLGSNDNVANPFCKLSQSYCQRPTGTSGRGGQVEYGKFFKGPAAVIGGIEYHTPWSPLRLKLEYEGNNYVNDRAGALKQDSRWNIGARYRWNDFDFALSYQRGNTLTFGVTYNFNLHTASQVKVEPGPQEVSQAPKAASFDEVDRHHLTQHLYRNAGYMVATSHIEDDAITLYGRQVAFRDNDVAMERVGRVLSNELPEDIEQYNIVENVGMMPMVETQIDAQAFKQAVRYQGVDVDVKDSLKRQAPTQKSLEHFNLTRESGFATGMEAFWIQTFGNPEAFYMYQGGVLLNGTYAFNRHFSVNGGVKATLLENLDKYNFKVDSLDTPLPRVRTYVREYVSGRRVTMENLFANGIGQVGSDLFGSVYGGYLETMFAGVGGELLYRPVDSQFAIGMDINYVQQRSFENDFDLFDYKTFTGHVNVHYEPDFMPDARLTFNIGQFLAGDRGVQVDFAKRFDSGIVLGAYAAFTNVSAEDYGEGSFTKGFYLSIPIDLFTLTSAKGRGRLPWIPIARDGGQPLQRPVKLIDLTEGRSSFLQ